MCAFIRTASVLISVAMVAMSAPLAQAGPSVAIVAAASNTANPETNTRFTDPRDKLMATGLFTEVAIFNATAFNPSGGTPTLAYLQQYDAVLVWSNDSFDDAVAMGNVLADYVDSGGGVVVAVFSNTTTHVDRHLQGRWQDPMGGYIAIPQLGGFTQGTTVTIGTIHIPGHPIFDGVNSFLYDVGAGPPPFGAWRPTTTALTAGSTLVATFSDGKTLVALAPNPRVVELGFHPVSEDVNAGYWNTSSDGARLMANALLFSMPPAACDGDVDGSKTVDVNDISYVVFRLGTSGTPGEVDGDADGNGTVDVNDITYVVFRLGQPC